MVRRSRQSVRSEQRDELEQKWLASRRLREAGWPKADDIKASLGDRIAVSESAIRDECGAVRMEVQFGAAAEAGFRGLEGHFAKQRKKIRSWNRKVSGQDVRAVLQLALALTNNPAYEAALSAIKMHGLETGGLKQAFMRLQNLHDEPPEYPCARLVRQYLVETDLKFRQAVEHAVAATGLPGTSFSGAVEKVRKAYAKLERHDTEREKYFAGIRTSTAANPGKK